ncbi:MAG: hypothetical protein H7Y04_03545 [Verrucomicrobia bacterium]|nr:hypothetical protein [Cytophagales bacterium]
MDLKDILLVPLYLPFVYLWALWYRRNCADKITRKYFLPAFTVKIIGAIALGLIYQFYYGGGDTFNYFHDTRIIWEAFIKSPSVGINLVFADGKYHDDLYQYTRQMIFYGDQRSYPVVQVAGLLGFVTFSTYTVTAIFFAIFCFTGVWALYQAFYAMFPQLHRQLAIAVFFIPSVFFWGSGLMKDTITLGALGWGFYAFYFGLIRREKIVSNLIILIISFLILKTIKIYILQCFLPAAFLWFFLHNRSQIKSRALRILVLPVVLALAIPAGYFAVREVSKEDTRYNLDKIAFTAKETATWLEYMSKIDGGSGYSLGTFDGSFGSMLTKAPQAVFITLYRPFLWEVRNPVMLLSAIESTIFLFLTLRIFWEIKLVRLFQVLKSQPIVIFCFLFAIAFSFGVGLTSYNFGSLVRYKIQMMPFFLSALYIVRYQARPLKTQVKRPRKAARFA